MQPKRGFVARFCGADVEHATEGAVEVEIYRESFALHRLVNDALKAFGPEAVPLGPASYEAFVEETRRRGAEERKGWEGIVRDGDLPLNFEGVAFRGDGSLLLGLRFPVAADGPSSSSSRASSASSLQSTHSEPEVQVFANRVDGD